MQTLLPEKVDSLAYALAPLNREAMLLVLRKHGSGSESDQKELTSHVFDIVMRESWLGMWNMSQIRTRMQENYFYQKMARTLVEEILDIGYCNDCGGTRWTAGLGINHKPKSVECHQCRGSGFEHWPNTRRAAGLGISRKSFNQVWCSRYEAIRTRLTNLEHYALQTMRERLK